MLTKVSCRQIFNKGLHLNGEHCSKTVLRPVFN